MLTADFLSPLRGVLEEVLRMATGAGSPATGHGTAEPGEAACSPADQRTAHLAQDARLLSTLMSLCWPPPIGDVVDVVDALQADQALASLFLPETDAWPVAPDAVVRQVAVRLLLPTLRRLCTETGSLSWDDAAWDRVLRWLDDCVASTSQVVLETTFLWGVDLSGPRIDIQPGLWIDRVTGTDQEWLGEREMHSEGSAASPGPGGAGSCIRRRFEIPKRPPYTGWNDKAADQLVSALRIHQPGEFWPTLRHWRILQPTLAPIKAVAPIRTGPIVSTPAYRLAGDDLDGIERLRSTFAHLGGES